MCAKILAKLGPGAGGACVLALRPRAACRRADLPDAQLAELHEVGGRDGGGQPAGRPAHAADCQLRLERVGLDRRQHRQRALQHQDRGAAALPHAASMYMS